MTQSTDRYAVFGNPIGQSKSPFIHTLFARQTNQNLLYTAETAEVDEFTPVISSFFEQGAKGCNVTAPFKLDAYKFANRLTQRAQLAGAVNTLKKLDDGEIIGDNTDGEGLVQDLLQNRVVLEEVRILIIGAGGAARGIVKPLLDQKPKEVVLTNRTYSKAEELATVFNRHGPVRACEMQLISQPFDLVINSTSAGFSGELPQVCSDIFSATTVSYDMMYGKGLTTFNQWAADNGVRQTLDGLGMLVGQAAESFMLWRGIRPGSKQILRELRRNLEA